MRFSFLESLSPIGLDLGSHSVKAVQLGYRSNCMRIVSACCLPRKAPGVPYEREELAALHEGLDRQGFSGRTVTVAMPNAKLLTSVLELPARNDALPMNEIALAEFCRINKKEPQAVTMSWWELPPSARASRTTHAIASGCVSRDAEEFIEMIESAGFIVEAVDVASSAAARACEPANSGSTDMTALLDLGWTAAVACIIKSGTLIYERRIPEAGLASLVKSLAEHAGIDLGDAQYLIQQTGLRESNPQAQASELDEDCSVHISTHCAKMIQEIRQSFGYARHQYPDVELSTLLLTGGGAGIVGLAPYLEKAMSLQVRIAKPWASVKSSGVCDHSILTAAGLAQFGSEVLA